MIHFYTLKYTSNEEKLTMSTKEDENEKEPEEPDYDEDQLEERQEEEAGETTNHVF